jgi:hypothetical protein
MSYEKVGENAVHSKDASREIYSPCFSSCLLPPRRQTGKILSAESEPGRAGIQHRHILLENAADGGHITFELAIFLCQIVRVAKHR